MIDFACKRFELRKIIKCGLGLTKADLSLFDYLLEHTEEWFTTEKLAKKLKLNLSTVQRSVKKLNEKEILMRRQENLNGGGYFFVYRIKYKSEIRKIILDVVRAWSKGVEKEFDEW